MKVLSVNDWPFGINNAGPILISIYNFIGTIILSLIEALRVIFQDIPNRHDRFYFEIFLENLRKIVWTCLPIATLTVGSCSIVYSIHVAPEFSSRGLNVYFGGLVALALIREGVPVMGSLAIVSQYCTSMAAQIGSMKITEQLDAMKVSRVNPVAYLLVPMLIAGLIGFPLIAIVCVIAGLIINFIFSTLLIHIAWQVYITSIYSAVVINDIFLALVKCSIFGFVVALVSYTCGVLTVGGSKALGRSTRLSVVINFALVIILDYLITAIWL